MKTNVLLDLHAPPIVNQRRGKVFALEAITTMTLAQKRDQIITNA
jgi:hypothetical protein